MLPCVLIIFILLNLVQPIGGLPYMVPAEPVSEIAYFMYIQETHVHVVCSVLTGDRRPITAAVLTRYKYLFPHVRFCQQNAF